MSDEQILNATIRERLAIRVGVPRLVLVLLPSSIFATAQTIYLISSMFDLAIGDYWIMFTICSLITILNLLYVSVLAITAKSEEIYNQRQQELVGLRGTKKGAKQVDQKDEVEIFEKKQTIFSDINYEATLFGVWLVNGCYLLSFVFMSFVVIRFWSTSWNYYGATIGAALMTQYLPFMIVQAPDLDD